MNVPVGPYFIRLETNTRTQAEGGSRIEGEPLIRAVVTRNPGHDLTHTSCVQWLVKYAVWVFAHMKKIIEETQELSLKESSMGRYDFDQEVNCLVRQTMCVMLKEAVALHVCDESGEMKLAVPQVSQIINQRMPPKYMDYLDIGYQVLESQIPPGQGIAVEWRL